MSLISSQNYRILIDEDISILRSFIDQLKLSKIFVIVDNNTHHHCLNYLEENLKLNFVSIKIAAGEEFKNLKTCSLIWDALIKNACDRHSLIINLGGGVIGDMGGFIASTYMRGIKFIQMPTTLLSQVDASIGGKLGIDFLFHKNMIGLFNEPVLVWVQSQFLRTLAEQELRSGFAEMIKHALISSKQQWESLKGLNRDPLSTEWPRLIEESIRIKKDIVSEDPLEQGIRKTLNFGHSIGHAIESFQLENSSPVRHGEAVAAGMICEAHISYQKFILKENELKEISHFIHSIFSDTFELSKNYKNLISLMRKDKKNREEKILIASLTEIGNCCFDLECSEAEIRNSFEYYENLY